MSAGIRRTEPGHCTQAQHRAQQKASCFAAGWPRSGSSLLHGIPCVPKSKTTEMRASQQALDWVLDENSSTGPTHSSIRTRGGPAVQQSTSLSTTRHSNLAFSSPNASLMRLMTGCPEDFRSTSKSCSQHLTFLKALKRVCSAAEAQPPHTPCCRP